MAKFLKRVLEDLYKSKKNPSDCTFILPNKRAGTFLKNEFIHLANKTSFAPDILSVEEFIESLSQLSQISNEQLIFESYHCYKEIDSTTDSTLDEFIGWIQPLLQDFNEIDRHLIEADDILNYLNNVKQLDHWSPDQEPTDLIKTYLDFWNLVPKLYQVLTTKLLNQQQGYQGLIYRESVEHLESYIQQNTKLHVFIGFNALNKAEEVIIQELLMNDLALIYWDINSHFIKPNNHLAGTFISNHFKEWKALQRDEIKWIDTTSYQSTKTISAVGAVKHIGQAQYVGHLISDLCQKNKSLDNVALVLADEKLLLPILNYLPTEIEAINITMGLPLTQVPLIQLLRKLISIHKKNTKSLYYKDVLDVLNHPITRTIVAPKTIDKLNATIKKKNLVFFSLNKLIELSDLDNPENIMVLFSEQKSSVELLDSFNTIIYLVKNKLKTLNKKAIEKEFTYKCFTIVQKLENLIKDFDSLISVTVLQKLFEDLVKREAIDFKGEPLKGLQIMGMLESRVLDFETIILVSLNEGILPSGKTTNSYIPFDLKIEYNLPTYQEKDAVYAYHFFRLVQHASQIHLIYNSESDSFGGGEMSRFILQLETEGIHEVNHLTAQPYVPKTAVEPKVIPKTKAINKTIIERLSKGISPSALLTYIRNPIDFYVQYVLGVKDVDEVEETVAANTLGTIIHESLKELYSPFLNKTLVEEDLKEIKLKIEAVVSHFFDLYYSEENYSYGKNLLLFEVAKRYINSFITNEEKAIKNGHSIEILGLEFNTETQLKIPGIDFLITLKGQVDRMDKYNGVIRIIDYKTGVVNPRELKLDNWGSITTDYNKYGKSFQVMCYSLMLALSDQVETPFETGIISFKKLKNDFMAFKLKENKTDQLVSDDMLLSFKKELFLLIEELIKSPEFIEKEA